MAIRKKIGPMPSHETFLSMLRSVGVPESHLRRIDPEQMAEGYRVEMEHWRTVSLLTPGIELLGPPAIARIAYDHLRELPDYYTRLSRMEREGEEYLRRHGRGMGGEPRLR